MSVADCPSSLVNSATSVAPVPLISIVTAVLNAEAVLPDLISSLRAQWDPRLEFIVIDGASTDGTQRLIAENRDIISKTISERDTGIYNAWNKGLELATGEWIAFIGADDVYAEGGLEIYLAAALAARSDTELISSRVFFKSLYGPPRIMGTNWSWPAFQTRMRIGHVGALHRRQLFERYGKYDESYRISGDYELLLRARDRLNAEFVDAITVNMADGGVSNHQLGRAFEEVFRAQSTSGGRNALAARISSVWGLCKIRIKHAILPRRSRP